MIGTVWALGHTPERHFDAEDARLLTSLARFAAVAHQDVTTWRRPSRRKQDWNSAPPRCAKPTKRWLPAKLAYALRWTLLAWALGVVRSPQNRHVLDAGLQRLLGVEGQDVMTFEQFVALAHPDDQSEVREAYALCSNRRASQGRVSGAHADGRITWLKDEGEVFYGPRGEPLFISGACVDITELKEAETALKEADRRKDEFIATLAHEIRNPLTPLANGLELVRTLGLDDPSRNRTSTSWSAS